MSTNFYIKKNSEENEDDSIHIGKRVCGWQFIFSNYKKTGADWIKFLKENSESIYDEYNRKLTFKELEENFDLNGEFGISKLSGKNATQTEYGPEVYNWKKYEFFDTEDYRISHVEFS